MAIPFEDSIERTTNASRFLDEVFADLTARDAFADTLRYEGMTCYVIAEGKNYQLVGGITDTDWVEFGGGGAGGSMVLNSFTASASQTVFALTADPGVKQNLMIQIDGVIQNYASYSLAGQNVTLDEAQPAGAIVEIRYNIATALTDVMKLKAPIYTEYNTFSSGNHIVGANTKLLYFEAQGPSGGGSGSSRASNNDMTNGGTPSGATTFHTCSFQQGNGGAKRATYPPLGGGRGVSVTIGAPFVSAWYTYGQSGEHGTDGIYGKGGRGGAGLMGPVDGNGGAAMFAGQVGLNGTGGGGGGGTGEAGSQGLTGAGGGSGAKGGAWWLNPTPGASLAYVIPDGGAGGLAGSAGYAGAKGGPGIIRIWEWE